MQMSYEPLKQLDGIFDKFVENLQLDYCWLLDGSVV